MKMGTNHLVGLRASQTSDTHRLPSAEMDFMSHIFKREKRTLSGPDFSTFNSSSSLIGPELNPTGT